MRLNIIGRCGLALSFSLGKPAGVASQAEAAPDTLLARLTQEALDSAPAVRRAEAFARAAEHRVRPAGALPDPMLMVGIMDLTLPRFAFRESDFTEVDVEVSQALPWPGTLTAQSRAAGAVARASRADLAALRREVITRVSSAYYRLQYVLAAQHVLARQQRLLGSVVEISTARYGTGSAPQSDPLQARTAVARLATDSAALAAEEASLRAELRAVRGIRGSEQLSPGPMDAGRVAGMLAETAAPFADGQGGEALAGHPRLRSRASDIEAAEHTVRVAALQGRPDFVITTRYGARPLGADFFSAFLGIRVPLWTGRKQQLLTEAARSEAESARSRLAEERAELEAELEHTAAEARAGATRLRLLMWQVVPLTRESVAAALREYRTGLVGFLNVLTAQDAAYRAELEAAEVAARYQSNLVILEQLLAPEEGP